MKLRLRDPGNEYLVDPIANASALDPLTKRLAGKIQQLPQPVRDLAHGVRLGHPAHPPLTDLPIGFWTAAFTLDFIAPRRGARVARTLIGLGILSAVPTIATGAVDFSALDARNRRVAVVHAGANVLGTGLYTWSWIQRWRGRRGFLSSLLGATVLTFGGFLGGHLVYRRGLGVDRGADTAAPDEWTALADVEERDDRTVGKVEDTVVLVTADGAIAARCSHLGGPLEDGDIAAGCVTCPWHASVVQARRRHRGPRTRGHTPGRVREPPHRCHPRGPRTSIALGDFLLGCSLIPPSRTAHTPAVVKGVSTTRQLAIDSGSSSMQVKKIVATVVTAGVVMVGGTSAAFAATTTPKAPAAHAVAKKALRHQALKAGVKLAAKTIGIDAKTLVSEVRSGKTVAEVAQAHNVDPQHVIDVVVTAGNKKIDEWAGKGKLSAERAAALKVKLATRVAELVNNTPHPAK